jgi:hypothetical protein
VNCGDCREEFFWKYTIITLLFGWWGVISFFVTPLILLANCYYYLKSWELGSLDRLIGIALGWKFLVLGVAAVGFYFVSAQLNLWPVSSQAAAGYPPTTTPAIYAATLYSPPAIRVPTWTVESVSPISGCKFWSDVEESSIGRVLCVYGLIQKVNITDDQKASYLIFGENTDFRLMAIGDSYRFLMRSAWYLSY